MPFIRKDSAGDAAYPDGTVDSWAEDGAVVDVTPDHARDLLAIRDGGFSEVEKPAPAVVPRQNTGRRAIRED